LKKYISAVLMILIIIFNVPICRAVSVSAVSAVVVDAFSGRVVFEKNANQKMSMASTTKIMTALCAIENSELDKLVKIHPSAVGVEGSSIYLKHGEHLTIRELVYGLMLSSGNDAAVAIAYAVSGSVEKFAELMSRYDAVLMPACSATEYKAYDIKDAFQKVFAESEFTAVANLIGVPALATCGVQLMGKAFSESVLLSLAAIVEKEGK